MKCAAWHICSCMKIHGKLHCDDSEYMFKHFLILCNHDAMVIIIICLFSLIKVHPAPNPKKLYVQLAWYLNIKKGRTQCRELPLCAGSGEECLWQALPSPVQCEKTTTRTRELLVTGDKTLPLAPGPPFGI